MFRCGHIIILWNMVSGVFGSTVFLDRNDILSAYPPPISRPSMSNATRIVRPRHRCWCHADRINLFTKTVWFYQCYVSCQRCVFLRRLSPWLQSRQIIHLYDISGMNVDWKIYVGRWYYRKIFRLHYADNRTFPLGRAWDQIYVDYMYWLIKIREGYDQDNPCAICPTSDRDGRWMSVAYT